MWAYESVFYQIYPIGFCGAPRVNDGVTVSAHPQGQRLGGAYRVARLQCRVLLPDF